MKINSGKNILVVGGAGFVGSHMVLCLKQAGFHPIVLDNLSTGHQQALWDTTFIEGDCGNKSLLKQLFSAYSFLAVMHFASFIEVGESMRLPLKYYQNNVGACLPLLEVMQAHQVAHFIFSSTAAVYGNPITSPITESHPLAPINPYGRSKLMLEEIIQDVAKSHGLRFAILRYFNAAGADPQGRIGEWHQPESHLIPIILQVAANLREKLTINGNRYQTADGTCIRDYIHVADICQAHLLALEYLLMHEDNLICNLGNGKGYSILEVINTVERVINKTISYQIGPERLGDPASLVADATFAKKELGWKCCYDLSEMIGHAWQVMQKQKLAFAVV